MHRVNQGELAHVTKISRSKRDELVLIHSPGKDLLAAGLVTGIALTALTAAVLLPLYRAPGSLSYLFIALATVFLLSLTAGVFLPLEHRLISSYRITSGFPLFATVSFVVWTAVSFVLYLGDPDFLGFRRLLTVFFVLPLLATFIISLVYAAAGRKIFIQILYRLSRLDFVSLFYQDSISAKLAPLWDTAQRYGGHLSLFFIRLAFAPSWDNRSVDEEDVIEMLDRAVGVLRGRIRGSDEAGIYSREVLWVILPQTSTEEANVPTKRLLDEMRFSPRLEAYRNKRGLRVGGSFITEAAEEMLESQDLVNAAVSGLQAV